jgi:hypothetical protein
MDKQYYENCLKKIKIFKDKTGTKKQIFFAMISANGITPTVYSEELISKVVILNDLFSE